MNSPLPPPPSMNHSSILPPPPPPTSSIFNSLFGIPQSQTQSTNTYLPSSPPPLPSPPSISSSYSPPPSLTNNFSGIFNRPITNKGSGMQAFNNKNISNSRLAPTSSNLSSKSIFQTVPT